MRGIRIGILYDLKDKLSGGLGRIQEKFKGLNQNLDQFKLKNSQMFDAIQTQFPVLDRLMEFITNPYIMGAAAVAGLILTLGQATAAAGNFNHEFLDIRQLNLDKSQNELTEYRSLILDTAIITGKSAIEMSKAFYDVQSATGLFGADVQKVVRQVGDFSTATKADLNQSINGTIKSMKTFGFGVNEVTAFLESNAKTVQVGITTFDELAQVQTEFGGAAKAAGQDFNTANKLFAAFTASSKDAQIAATMTKSAFQGLTAKPTIDGLSKIGVSLFDANGGMRNLDEVIRELQPKIAKMSDSQFLEMRNAIGGPEGLQNLFNQLRSSGDDFIKTLDAFDRSEFSIDEALKNAKGDFNTLKDIVGNQLNVMMINLGEKILPAVARGLAAISDAISWVYDNSERVINILQGLLAGLLILKAPAILTFALWAAQTAIATLATFSLQGALIAVRTALFSIPIVGWIAAAVVGLVTLYNTWAPFREMVDGTLNVFKEFIPVLKAIAELVIGAFTMNPALIGKALSNLKSSFENFDLSGAYDRGVQKSREQMKGGGLADAASAFAPKDPTTGDPVDGSGSNNESLAANTSQQRNVTVNIQNLNEGGINLTTNTLRESATDVESAFMEMLIKAIRNVEQAL